MPFAFTTGRTRDLTFTGTYALPSSNCYVLSSGEYLSTGYVFQGAYRDGTGRILYTSEYGFSFQSPGWSAGFANESYAFKEGDPGGWDAGVTVGGGYSIAAVATALHYYESGADGPYADMTLYAFDRNYNVVGSLSLPNTYVYASSHKPSTAEGALAAPYVALMAVNPTHITHAGPHSTNFPFPDPILTAAATSGVFSITAQLEEIYENGSGIFGPTVVFRERFVEGSHFLASVDGAASVDAVISGTVRAELDGVGFRLYEPFTSASGGASVTVTQCSLGSLSTSPLPYSHGGWNQSQGTCYFPFPHVTRVDVQNRDFAGASGDAVTIRVNPLGSSGEGPIYKTVTGDGSYIGGQSRRRSDVAGGSSTDSLYTVDTKQTQVRYLAQKIHTQGLDYALTLSRQNLQCRRFDLFAASFDISGIVHLGDAAADWNNPNFAPVTTSYPGSGSGDFTLRITVGSAIDYYPLTPMERYIQDAAPIAPVTRFLQIKYRSVGSGGAGFFLNLGGDFAASRGWALTTGADGVWKTDNLDLLAASYPGVAVTEGIFSLVSFNPLAASQIEFRELEYDTVYEIQFVKPVVVDKAVGSVLENEQQGAYEGLIDGFPGRLGEYPHPVTEKPWLISDLAPVLSGGPDFNDPPGPYEIYAERHLLTSDLVDVLLEGFDTGGKVLERGLPLTMNGLLVTQTLFLYPGAGDIVNLTYGDMNIVTARTVWRTEAHGVELTPTGGIGNRIVCVESRDAAHSLARRTPPDSWGQSPVGTLGYWKTGTPYVPDYNFGDRGDGKDWQPYVALRPPYLRASDHQELTAGFTRPYPGAGMRQWYLIRCLARVVDAPGALSNDISRTGRLAIGCMAANGMIDILFTGQYDGQGAAVSDDLGRDALPYGLCVRYGKEAGSPLYLAAVEAKSGSTAAGKIVLYRTRDYRTWEAVGIVADIATGTYPAFCALPSGAIAFAYVDGADLKTKATDTEAREIVAPVVAQTPVSAQPADICYDPVRRRLFLTFADSSGVHTKYSSDMGKTWT